MHRAAAITCGIVASDRTKMLFMTTLMRAMTNEKSAPKWCPLLTSVVGPEHFRRHLLERGQEEVKSWKGRHAKAYELRCISTSKYFLVCPRGLSCPGS